MPKRKYRIRKMPKKLGGINPWFVKFGFNGTGQDDDDETDFKDIFVEEEAFEENEEETVEKQEEETSEEEVEIFDCCNISMINGEEEDQ